MKKCLERILHKKGCIHFSGQVPRSRQKWSRVQKPWLLFPPSPLSQKKIFSSFLKNFFEKISSENIYFLICHKKKVLAVQFLHFPRVPPPSYPKKIVAALKNVFNEKPGWQNSTREVSSLNLSICTNQNNTKTHTYTHIHTHTYNHTHTHIHTHSQTHTYTHVYTHTNNHTHTNTSTYIHNQTPYSYSPYFHTYTLSQACWSSQSYILLNSALKNLKSHSVGLMFILKLILIDIRNHILIYFPTLTRIHLETYLPTNIRKFTHTQIYTYTLSWLYTYRFSHFDMFVHYFVRLHWHIIIILPRAHSYSHTFLFLLSFIVFSISLVLRLSKSILVAPSSRNFGYSFLNSTPHFTPSFKLIGSYAALYHDPLLSAYIVRLCHNLK